MQFSYHLVNYSLLGYLMIYSLVHFPLDAIMLLKRGKASYSNPSFPSPIEAILIIIPTGSFWLYLIIAPCISLVLHKDIYTWSLIPEKIILPFRLVGAVLMGIGLIVGCLGRIGRWTYISYDKAKLSTNWGHAIVRHPAYFMYILSFIGLPLITMSP
ncbi:MAG: hypothetical protein ACTSQE_05410 [Candidatus Heimdallarchaeaceae archaeon]